LTSELVRLGTKKLVEELLEAEVNEVLGRGWYERRQDGQVGSRNGNYLSHLRTAEGRVPIDVPEVRDVPKDEGLRLWKALKKRSEVLERLVVEMYVRGLSTRDIEATLSGLREDDEPALLGRSSVSRVTETLWEEYEAFAERDLSGFEVVYLFADAVYESLRQQAGVSEGILVTWAILADGSKVIIHMSLGNKESRDDWLEHFRDMVRRGLQPPLTVTTDGAPGLIQAVETMWPEAERIRCWVHKMRNVLDKVPETVRSELKSLLTDVRDAPTYEKGKQRAEELIQRYEKEYPSAVRSFKNDLEASLNHLKLPTIHRKTIRTTNLIERSFEEERRRAKVIPRFRTEKECLKLVFGTLWRASERWRRVSFSEHEQKQLERYLDQRARIRRSREKDDEQEEISSPTVA